MATSCSLILLLQFVFLATTSIFLRTNGAAVDTICGLTKDPSLCSKSLGSDSRSKSAALPQLAQIAIDTAEYNAVNAKTKIHSYVLGAKSPDLKGLYVKCENLYLDALAGLRDAPGELKGRQYAALTQTGLRVRSQVEGCEAAFKNNSPFTNENQIVGVLADAIAVIAKKL